METVAEWIPGDVPPDEEYWRALLGDGENCEAVFAVAGVGPVVGRGAGYHLE